LGKGRREDKVPILPISMEKVAWGRRKKNRRKIPNYSSGEGKINAIDRHPGRVVISRKLNVQ
jgi:hypothetical protein